MTNESKTWSLNFRNSEFHIEFTESVDIREAFAAIPADNTAWMEHIADTDNDTINVGCRFRSFGFVEFVPAFFKAVAETFPAVAFSGDAWMSDMSCYWEDSYEVSYNNGVISMTETFADDEHGYFCPECGSWVAPCHETFDEDEEIECEDCEEVIDAADLEFVPPTVTKHEIVIK